MEFAGTKKIIPVSTRAVEIFLFIGMYRYMLEFYLNVVTSNQVDTSYIT